MGRHCLSCSGAALLRTMSTSAGSMSHTAVMPAEVAAAVRIGCNHAIQRAGLGPQSRVVVLDATVGGGSHAKAILESNPNAVVLGVDRDHEVLEQASHALKEFQGRVLLAHASFATMPEVLAAAKPVLHQLGAPEISSCEGLARHVAANGPFASSAAPTPDQPQQLAGDRLSIPLVGAVLMDLGINSVHVDDASRGFSYRRDGPLDMRFDRQAGKESYFDADRNTEGEQPPNATPYVLETFQHQSQGQGPSRPGSTG